MISTSLVDLSRSRYAVRVCDAVRAVLLALTLREQWGLAGVMPSPTSLVGQLPVYLLVELLVINLFSYK